MKKSTKPPAGDELLDLYDVSVALHISPAAAEYICAAGLLPAHRKGIMGVQVWRIKRSDLDQFLGRAVEVSSIEEFYAQLEASRKRREEAHRLLDASGLDWGSQDKPEGKP